MTQVSRGKTPVVPKAGSVAIQILSEVRSGRIAAVFERSFYIDFHGRLVCFGDASIGNGPLNVLPGRNWRAIGLRVGDSVLVDGAVVSIDGCRVFEIDAADVWTMPEQPTEPDAALVTGKLETIVQSMHPFMPADGLASLIGHPCTAAHGDPLLQFVSRPFDALKRWLTRCLDCARNRVTAPPGELGKLIGAGPGLTPSGDDLLIGVMATLHRLEKYRMLARLSNCIHAELGHRTNPISAAHLVAAMDGLAGESMMTVIDELIFAPRTDAERLARELDRIGATSGWDSFVGIVVVLEAWANGCLAGRQNSHTEPLTIGSIDDTGTCIKGVTT
jgi:hypothetical protein